MTRSIQIVASTAVWLLCCLYARSINAATPAEEKLTVVGYALNLTDCSLMENISQMSTWSRKRQRNTAPQMAT